jgi:hypothetical protein
MKAALLPILVCRARPIKVLDEADLEAVHSCPAIAPERCVHVRLMLRHSGSDARVCVRELARRLHDTA